jgi:hypothetical protein
VNGGGGDGGEQLKSDWFGLKVKRKAVGEETLMQVKRKLKEDDTSGKCGTDREKISSENL